MRRAGIIAALLTLAAAGVILSQTSTQNPHGNLKWDCQDCHTSESWTEMRRPMKFDHGQTGFVLSGAHASAQCIGCHKDLDFSHVGTSCVDCHADHHQGQVGLNCQNCHTTRDWSNRRDEIELHARKGFPLVGVHAITDCEACHTGASNQIYSNTPVECIGCHAEAFNSTTAPNHAARGFDRDCRLCHSTNAWSPSTFDHSKAGTNCYGCHQPDFASAKDPDHATGGFDHNCALCHTVTAWIPATFDHATSAFPLTGAHTTVACASCHTTGFVNTPTDCYACHQTVFASATNPSHTTNNFSHACTTCHNTVAWQPSTFNHATTSFALTGAHATVACASCHTNGYTGGTPTDCYSCHQTSFAGATNPSHTTNNFSHTCTTCHNTVAWQPSTFDHSTTTFVLTGAHSSVACASCHTSGYTGGTPTDCYACHQSVFTSASSPSHTTNNFSHTCTTCHNTVAWQPSTFNHATTPFPLTGAHLSVNCGACHTVGYVAGQTPNDCWSCHQTAYLGTTDPNHQTQNFSHDCTQCHTTANWGTANFSHAATGFVLTGAHLTATCASCHTTGYNGGTPTDCNSCHQMDYAGAKSPDHAASSISRTCVTCHNTTAWQPSIFDHSTTSFPLTGAHPTVACASCHTNGFAGGTPTDCYACHQTVFATAASPNHVTNNFNHACVTCHNTTAWQPSTFNHASTTFPLTGAHPTVACASCHTNGYSGGTPTDCYSCHTADFTGATPLNHVSNNISHTCTTCHTTTAWTPPTFNHATTTFPLTGAHTTATCGSCHTNGYSGGTPTDCYSCHTADFTGATPLNHVSNNISHTCTTCHTTTAWTPPTFNHATTTFPLTGAHPTVACASCHTNGYSGGTPTDCYSCHTADFTGATPLNHVSNNISHTCTTCHNTTAWTPPTFNHATTTFPLTGAHPTVACASCHTNGYSGGTPTDCYACHTADYNGTNNPSHTAANFPTTCITCHTTTNWTTSTWNHDTQYFPISSGTHSGFTCVTCHVNPSNYATFECILCHTHNQTTTDSHHTGVRNYQYLSTACYSCHPRGSSGG